MKKTLLDYQREAAEEIAKMSPDGRAASVEEMDLLAYRESSQMKARALASHDPGQFVADAVVVGEPGAMLLKARESSVMGRPQEALMWNMQAFSHGSAEAAFILGMDAWESNNVARAFSFLKAAFERKHPVSPYALASLCGDYDAAAFGTDEKAYAEIKAASTHVAQQLMMKEALYLLGEGAHPVQYRDDMNIPWGSGTLFLVKWKGADLAITAKHVIFAAGAQPSQLQLIVPFQEEPLPVHDDLPSEFLDADGDDLDIHIWKIRQDKKAVLEWNSWRLEELCKSAKDLPMDSAVFVVGFPNFDDKVDYAAGKMSRSPLVVKGRLGGLYGGLFTIDCAEFSTDVDGVSGGPVFCRHGGVFYFIGLCQRGGAKARTLYFLDSSEILPVLDHFV